jgi:hypothetical protein
VLAEIRLRADDPFWRQHAPSGPVINLVLQGIMSLRERRGLDCPPFTFIEALHRAASLAAPPKTERQILGKHPCNPTLMLRSLLASEPGSTLYAATCCGIQGYVDWKLSTDPGLLNNHEKTSTLAGLAVASSLCQGVIRASTDPFVILGVLLQRGLSPQTVVHKDSTGIKIVDGMTIWELFIFILVWLIINNHSSLFLSYEWKAQAGQTIQRALEHGANSKISIEILFVEGEQGPIHHVLSDLRSYLRSYCYCSRLSSNTAQGRPGSERQPPRPRSCHGSIQRRTMDSRKLETSGGH